MPYTILAIDDEPIILEMFQATLDESYTVHAVTSGREGLEFLAVHPRVDLILLDIMMPEMDGYEVCRAIRENPLYSHIKIILVSAKMLLEDRLRGYVQGADDYITKPFDENELRAKVKVFLRLKNVEEIDKIKTHLIALLSQEAHTPLSIILGCAGLLKDRPNLLSEDKYLVDQIIKSGRSISRSSEATILLSDLKSGKLRPRKETIQLGLLLTESQLEFSKQAAKKNLEIQVSLNAERNIEADRRLLRIALDALVDNAVNFAYAGTVIEMTVKDAAGRIRLEVANDGKQISLDRQKDIFDEFAAHDDLEHDHQRHGLSLALARRICEVHEGSLTAQNHDKGPVFIIDFKS